jgi:hypothetical protein
MTTVACFCGYLYCFAGDEAPCPQCGTVAVIKAKATGQTNDNREQNEPERPPGLRRAELLGTRAPAAGAA